MRRYACLWVPHFAAVALVRRDLRLRGRPVAALAGNPGTRAVHEVSAEAWRQGVRPGMGVSEAQTRVPPLVCHDRDPEAEGSAAAALRDLALATTPRIEVMGPHGLQLDLAGLQTLWADEARLGERLVLGAGHLDLPARVGIAATRTLAALAARTGAEVTVVPAGTEAAFLAPIPMPQLDPEPTLAAGLERWGIRTLGELAALPPAGVLARLGEPGVRLQRRARGEDPEPFAVYVPAEPCAEALTLDWEVTSLEALAFVLRRLLERLAARLAVRELGARTLFLSAGLADGATHLTRLGLVAPLREPRTLLRLLLADLAALTLPAPIIDLRLEVETARLGTAQADLFGPATPSPRELGETLGRLAALVGPERVGIPVLEDTHRPAAIGQAPGFAAAGDRAAPAGGPASRLIRCPPRAGASPLAGGGSPDGSPVGRRAAVAALALADATTLVCRRFTPPRPAEVMLQTVLLSVGPPPACLGAAPSRHASPLHGSPTSGASTGPGSAVTPPEEPRPRHVEAPGVRGTVTACAGPWRTAGEWWADTAWAVEEWDVALTDGAVYRLTCDRATGAWHVVAVYD